MYSSFSSLCGVGLWNCGCIGIGRSGVGDGVGSGSGGSRISGISLIVIFAFRLFRRYGERAELFSAENRDFCFLSDNFVSE
jgi:hypothetical protein